MLAAIHQVIDRLGLYPEELNGAAVADSAALLASDSGYYRREYLLPHTRANRALRDIFFGGARKPIFTTASAHNHLITLAEVAAMYLTGLVAGPLVDDPPGSEPTAAAATDGAGGLLRRRVSSSRKIS